MSYVDKIQIGSTAYDVQDTKTQQMIAGVYSTSGTYAVGDYVTYDGKLYRCVTAIDTAEAWTVAHWTEVTVGEDVADLKSAIDNIATQNTIYGKNLYNPNDADYEAGYRASNTTGLPTEDSAWNLTGFIPLATNETVVVSRGGGGVMENSTNVTRIYAYKTDKTFISATYNTGITFYTAPAECAYIRCAVSSLAAFSDHQIEYGTTMTDYEPYSPPIEVAIPNDDFVEQIKMSKLNNDAGFLTIADTSLATKELALPSTIYGFKNVKMVLYPYNFMQYSPNDVYVSYTTSNNGKVKTGRWEDTPSAAKTYTFKTNIFDHCLRGLEAGNRQVVVKDASVKSSLKVMVIGDSTVQAGAETAKLLELATADEYSVTLLGTRGTAPNLTEGRGGWTATMYAHNASNPSGTVTNAFYNPSTELFDFSYYMEQQGYTGVDCVFIQLGINDLFSAKNDTDLATAIETYLSDMDIIIDSIHDYDPNIKIIVNTIFPSDTDADTFGETYGVAQTIWRYRQNVYQGNRALIEHYDNETNIYVSWFGSSIDVENNMSGDVHPSNDGYVQLGTQMYGVMRAFN